MEFRIGPNATGTYIKIIQCNPRVDNDAYLVLYLLRSGIYLFIGYWKGYELTVAAGSWNESNEHIRMDGVGATLLMDVVPFNNKPRRHEREFKVVIEDFSPALFVETEHEDWSLLSWAGRFNYLGRFYFFDLKNDQLPRSFGEIETWAKQFMDSYGFKIPQPPH